MKYLKNNELKKLPDKRLLALFKSTSKRMHSAYAYVTDYGNNPRILSKTDNDQVKDCIRLNKYCDQIKSVLDTRGHIERKKK